MTELSLLGIDVLNKIDPVWIEVLLELDLLVVVVVEQIRPVQLLTVMLLSLKRIALTSSLTSSRE